MIAHATSMLVVRTKRSDPAVITVAACEQPKEHHVNHTSWLSHRHPDHLDHLAGRLRHGDIAAFEFNGIYVFIGDADRVTAARRIAEAKHQSHTKPLVLICAPEYLDEFVDRDAPVLRTYPLDTIKRLQREVYCLGVRLPAAKTGLPAHLTYQSTLVTIWMEYPPHRPAHYLQEALRRRGGRALMGSSVNRHGEPTFTDGRQAMEVFGNQITALVHDDLRTGAAPPRTQSSTIIDFTGPVPQLLRAGSLTIMELRSHLRAVGLPDLCVRPPDGASYRSATEEVQ